MNKTIYEIKTMKEKDGTVKAENSYIYTPKINYNGEKTKWLADKYKN